MLKRSTPTGLAFAVIAAGLSLFVSTSGMAASKDLAEGSHTHARTARCALGIAQDGSNNCMSRAEYDITRSRQAALDADPAQYMRNALMRCEGLKGDDQQDCISRIKGGGTTSGSVQGGGLYRELVTIIPGKPAPASPPAAEPATGTAK